MIQDLLAKYNIAGPRYTSYPTVPYWDAASFSLAAWQKSLRTAGDQPISLYIHLPFCESLCTYCGCNTRITKNHAVETTYIQAIHQEWKLYREVLPQKPVIKEIHLGGGTPTFFSPKNLAFLIQGILEQTTVADEHEFSFEGHPNNTTAAHLKALYDLGFRRVSLGIQDFDPNIQKMIHRIQPLEKVKDAVEEARNIGFESVNFDLIYGLPGQTETTMIDTLQKTVGLSPDRIAFYSYAHIPDIKPAQRSYEKQLPDLKTKSTLYEVGKAYLALSGYHDLGMDHFALAHDPLYQAQQSGGLHRNFMGYTSQQTSLLIGLGVSAIGDSWDCFAQNEKKVEQYYSRLAQGELPIIKGHQLTETDLFIREKILDLICRFETSWDPRAGLEVLMNQRLLDDLVDDGLLEFKEGRWLVTPHGKPFIRNICMAFDVRMNRARKSHTAFSKTV